MKTSHKLFDEWCGIESDTWVAEMILHGEISSKQVGFWRRGKAEPSHKSKRILMKYGFDWGQEALKTHIKQPVYFNGELVSNCYYVKDVKPTQETVTIEFQLVKHIKPNHLNRCECCDLSCAACGFNWTGCKPGYYLKRVKNYETLTRERAKVGTSVRCKKSLEKKGLISYVKKNQDQCVVDWGGSETTIAFEHLEVEI